MAAHDQSEATDQEHGGERAEAGSVQLTPRERAEEQRECDVERGGEPRRVVQRQRRGERERA
jgi:hypothetical protein